MARPTTTKPMLAPETLATLDAIRAQGWTYQSIASALNISYVTAYRAINRQGPYQEQKTSPLSRVFYDWTS